MILDKKIIKKVNNYVLWRYKDKYNCNAGDIIEIPISELSVSSHEKIRVKCDNCGKEYTLKFQTYIRNTQNEKYNLYCSNKECINIKRKLIINEKYGVDNIFQLEKVKKKIMKTNNEKYGVDNPQQNKEIKEKTEKTNLEKYGFKNVFQNEKIKQKIKQTNLERYGVEFTQQSNILRLKTQKTNIENYGFSHPMQNKEYFEKISKANYHINQYKDTELYYQGLYEKDFLDNYYDKITIENGISIKYNYKNKGKIYHSDFYLPEYKIVVEIKSSWWFKQHKEKCLAKEHETKKNHNYIMILDKNYDELNIKIMTN